MSYADLVFVRMVEDILKSGVKEENNLRAKWQDGTFAHTIKKFGVVNRYDLSKEFPILTLRPVNFEKAVDEILWIWQKKSNRVSDLSSKIWHQWADKEGTIGKAYGYQMGISHKYREGWFDQVDRVIYDLKNNPGSRRMLTNMYVHEDLFEMQLYPCAYGMNFNVTGNKLNAVLNQRSQDVLTANGWNVCQYAVLLHMFASVSNFAVGELVHVITDAHIYDKHLDMIKELIKRPQYPAPVFSLNREIRNFYEFKVSDFRLLNYEHGEQIKFSVAE